MSSLSKQIEDYLKMLLEQEEEGILIVQRSVLSERFACVPSQINYVLRTRFTPTDGYIVETRRGGGGYVRIQSIPINDTNDFTPLMEAASHNLSEQQEEGILNYLVEEHIISSQVGDLLKSIMKDRVLQIPQPLTVNELRAHLMTHLIANISAMVNESDAKSDDK